MRNPNLKQTRKSRQPAEPVAASEAGLQRLDDSHARMAARDAAHGHDASHVSDCGLLAAEDRAIANLARRQGRIIVSQDADFLRPSPGVRALRLGLGNASTSELIEWLTPRLETALARFASGEAVVVLES